MSTILAIFLGGGLGSLARFGVGRLVLSFGKSALPWGTFLANVLACVLLGLFVYVYGPKLEKHVFWRAFLIIGFCGGFSTFSTFSYETLELFRSGAAMWGIANILVSVLLCITILWTLSRA